MEWRRTCLSCHNQQRERVGQEGHKGWWLEPKWGTFGTNQRDQVRWSSGCPSTMVHRRLGYSLSSLFTHSLTLLLLNWIESSYYLMNDDCLMREDVAVTSLFLFPRISKGKLWEKKIKKWKQHLVAWRGMPHSGEWFFYVVVEHYTYLLLQTT